VIRRTILLLVFSTCLLEKSKVQTVDDNRRATLRVRVTNTSSQPSQTGRNGTGVSEFFSMGEGQQPVFNWPKRNL